MRSVYARDVPLPVLPAMYGKYAWGFNLFAPGKFSNTRPFEVNYRTMFYEIFILMAHWYS